MLLAVLISGSAAAGFKVIKNDNITGTGGVNAGISFGEFEGAGVLFEPASSDYPLKIVAIDVLCLPYMLQGGSGQIGLFEFDLWDESGGTVPPPVSNDGGNYVGQISKQGISLTTSTSMFNRFTFAVPVMVPSGRVFVKVSEQTQTSLDGTTIAVDNAPSLKPNANWFFNGGGGFSRIDLPDGGFFNNIQGNWVIRLVLEVPDVAVTVTSISPTNSPTNVSTNVVITGTNFEIGARAFLGTNELTLTNLTQQTIAAIVPIGIAPGLYDVKVRNLSGVEGVLSNGYQVLSSDGGTATGGGAGGGGGGVTGGGSGGGNNTGTEALSLLVITPAQTYAGDATSVFITGAGFGSGAKVLIGGIKLDDVVVESGSVISSVVKANQLTPGTYDLTVLNLDGAQATLAQSFKVLAGTKARPGCSCSNLELFPLLLAALAMLRRRAR